MGSFATSSPAAPPLVPSRAATEAAVTATSTSEATRIRKSRIRAMSVFVEVGVQWVRGRQPVPGWKLIPTTAGVDTRVGAGGSGGAGSVADRRRMRAAKISPMLGPRAPRATPYERCVAYLLVCPGAGHGRVINDLKCVPSHRRLEGS